MFLWYGVAEWLLCPGVIRCFFISMGTKNGFGSDSVSYKPQSKWMNIEAKFCKSTNVLDLIRNGVRALERVLVFLECFMLK